MRLTSIFFEPALPPLRRSSFLSRASSSGRQGHHHFTAASVLLISAWRLSSPSWPCALTSTLQLRVWSFRHWRSDDEETKTCGPKVKHASTVRSCCLIEELALGLQIGDAVAQFDLRRLAADFCLLLHKG